MSHDAISEWVEAAHAAWLRTGDEKTLRRSLLELLQYLELNELLKRIDAFAKHLEGKTPGIRLARADAVRVILVRGLAELEKDQPTPKRRA